MSAAEEDGAAPRGMEHDATEGVASEAGSEMAPAPHPWEAACRTRWPPGLMLWRVPGRASPGRAGSAPGWADLTASEREDRVCEGHPVVVVTARDSDQGMVLIFDGVESYHVPLNEVAPVPADTVEWAARPFTHAAATPSPRSATPAGPAAATPPPPSPLGWLSSAGLRDAGQATFEVPGRALRHIVGRGGATIRRLEAGLGVLIGALDGPGGSGAVALCGPPERLAPAERLIRLVGQGHRTVLARLADCVGALMGSGG